MKMRNFFPRILCPALLLTLCGCSLLRPATPATRETTAPETTLAPLVTTAVTAEETTAETTAETAPPPPKTTTASFVGAGDNIIYYGNVRDAKSLAVEGGRPYNFAPSYEHVEEQIAGADIAFINQETLMCGEGYEFSYYPQFNGPQDLSYDLAEVGFDVVNIANNHMLDKGEAGLAATIDHWRTLEDVTLIGGYKSAEEYAEPTVLTVNEIKIAFLSYTFHTNGLRLPAKSSLVIPYPEDETVIAQLSRAKEIADYIIVSVHWGDVENVFTPDENQTSFARLLSDNGADAILGHHPHVIQPIEWLESESGHRTLCVYSLGNFMAEMARDYNMLGGLISFDIVKTGDEVTTENVLFTPTVFYFNTRFYKNQIYPLTEFTADLAASHGLAYYGRTITLDSVYGYLHKTVAPEFLPEALRPAA